MFSSRHDPNQPIYLSIASHRLADRPTENEPSDVSRKVGVFLAVSGVMFELRSDSDLGDLAAADQILGELDVTANGHVEEATRLRQQYIALCHKAIGISALNDS